MRRQEEHPILLVAVPSSRSGAAAQRPHRHGRREREENKGRDATYPGAVARARLRRPKKSSRRRAARTAAMTLLCKGLLPLHIYG